MDASQQQRQVLESVPCPLPSLRSQESLTRRCLARRKMSKGRVQPQRAEYVLPPSRTDRCLRSTKAMASPSPSHHLPSFEIQHTTHRSLPCPWLSSSNSTPYPSVPPGIPNTVAHLALIRAGPGQVYDLELPQGGLPLSLQVALCPVLPPTCHNALASCRMRTEPLIFSAALI